MATFNFPHFTKVILPTMMCNFLKLNVISEWLEGGIWLASSAQPIDLVNHIVQLNSYPETIEEEGSEAGSPGEEDPISQMDPGGNPSDEGLGLSDGSGKGQPPAEETAAAPVPRSEEKGAAEVRKRRRLEQAGIKVMPAAQRFARSALPTEG